MKQIILKFGLLAVLLFVLMELSKYSISSGAFYQEFMIAISAVALISFGFFLRNHISRESKLKDQAVSNEDKLKLLGISKREFEVLVEIAEGHSNQQIADRLFISENTIKTHVSNLLSKLNANRRTEAIKQAKEYGLL